MALFAAFIAPPMDFDYRDPKEISAVSLTLDSLLEPIVGYAKGISGKVRFDPAHPELSTGTIAVDVSSVRFANDGYTETARNYALNEKKHPQILLKIRRVASVKQTSKGVFKGVVFADLVCRGISQPKRLAVVATYLPGRAEERTNGKSKGDLLILRTAFDISRKAHGISDGIPDDLVGDKIEVRVAVVGIHYIEAKAAVARWEIEVADRDDPRLVRVERIGDRLTFGTSEGSLVAAVVKGKAGTTAFRLSPNPTFGEATGEFDAEGAGVLHTKDGDVPLHGRRVARFSPGALNDPKGAGFARLDLPRRMREAGASGLAVARIADDRVAETGTYGAEPDTLFQAGTMGVPAIHLAVLRLAAAGRIDLDRPANAYLGPDGIAAGAKGWGDRITVRDLMRGTGGFPDEKYGGFPPAARIPGLRESIGAPEIGAEPGTRENGSATNEAFLELVLNKAAGRPAAETVAREVFVPLGMTDSSYHAHPPKAAAGHYQGGEPTIHGFHVYPAALGSGLWTSIRDFSKLATELGRLIGGRPSVLLDARHRSLLARLDAPGSILGVRKGREGGMYLGGDPYGYYCEFFLRPAQGEGVVVLQNRMMGWRLTNAVVEAVRGAQ